MALQGPKGDPIQPFRLALDRLVLAGKMETLGHSPDKFLDEWRKEKAEQWYELVKAERGMDGKMSVTFRPVDIKEDEAIEGKHFRLRVRID